jgi:dephospho-CoA kinase
VFLYRQGWWLGPGILLLLIHALIARLWSDDPAPSLVTLAIVWLIVGLVFRIVAWLCRSYKVTEQRILVRVGVISRLAADVPRRRIQHTVMTQSLAERILGLGTVGVSTADGEAVNLLMIPSPNAMLELLRRKPSATAQAPPKSPPVIGLAGGIGAGKTEVARIFHRLGCMVIDSDKEAKEALDRPEVRDQLVKWWGSSVIGPEGKVDRKAIANIIFKSDKDRAALEALVHPLVRARRGELKKSAIASGAAGVVIDAPLLFEAGVDSECDVVVFVDASRETRLKRVKESRRWDEAEFERREKAQMPLEEKKLRSAYIIENDGKGGKLAREVEDVLERVKDGWQVR